MLGADTIPKPHACPLHALLPMATAVECIGYSSPCNFSEVWQDCKAPREASLVEGY